MPRRTPRGEVAAAVGAGLDHDDRTGMFGEQMGERVRFGVDGAEGMVAGAARINAGNGLEPAQVDGENGIGHGKPPKHVKGDPFTLTPRLPHELSLRCTQGLLFFV